MSATSQSDGHPVLSPEYTSSSVLILDTVSAFSVLFCKKDFVYGPMMVLHFPSVLTIDKKCSQALHSFQSSIYNFRRLPLTYIFFSPSYREQTQHPVHQMQYHSPAPQSPNKTLWCQIDTLVNSTSWIWYCLATAETTLLVASTGWWAHGSKDGLCGGDVEGQWMALTIMEL